MHADKILMKRNQSTGASDLLWKFSVMHCNVGFSIFESGYIPNWRTKRTNLSLAVRNIFLIYYSHEASNSAKHIM